MADRRQISTLTRLGEQWLAAGLPAKPLLPVIDAAAATATRLAEQLREARKAPAAARREITTRLVAGEVTLAEAMAAERAVGDRDLAADVHARAVSRLMADTDAAIQALAPTLRDQLAKHHATLIAEATTLAGDVTDVETGAEAVTLGPRTAAAWSRLTEINAEVRRLARILRTLPGRVGWLGYRQPDLRPSRKAVAGRHGEPEAARWLAALVNAGCEPALMHGEEAEVEA